MPRIGGGDAVRNNIEAQRAGMGAYQQASESRVSQIQGDRQLAQQAGAQAEQSASNHLQRQEQTRQFDVQQGEQKRHNQMGEAIAQDEQDIQAADRGVERGAGGMSRADELRQKMAEAKEARGEKQMNSALEVPDSDRRTLSPTAERAAKDVAKANTDRMNAEAAKANAMRNLAEAHAKGDAEGIKAAAKSVHKDIEMSAGLFNRLKKGAASDQDKASLLQMASAQGGGVLDPALAQDIDALDAKSPMGPRLQQFLQNKIDFDSLRYIAGTHGEWPDSDLVDSASPMMQAFTQSAAQNKAFLSRIDGLTDNLISSTFGIVALDQRNRLVRRVTAGAMLTQIEAGNMPKGGSPSTPPPTQNNGQQPRPQQSAPAGQRPAPGAQQPAPGAKQPAQQTRGYVDDGWPGRYKPGGKQ